MRNDGRYPEGLNGRDYCYMEGCIGKGPCPRCGKTNYAWMGYWGAVARWAKTWGVSEEVAQRRITLRQAHERGIPF